MVIVLGNTPPKIECILSGIAQITSPPPLFGPVGSLFGKAKNTDLNDFYGWHYRWWLLKRCFPNNLESVKSSKHRHFWRNRLFWQCLKESILFSGSSPFHLFICWSTRTILVASLCWLVVRCLPRCRRSDFPRGFSHLWYPQLPINCCTKLLYCWRYPCSLISRYALIRFPRYPNRRTPQQADIMHARYVQNRPTVQDSTSESLQDQLYSQLRLGI